MDMLSRALADCPGLTVHLEKILDRCDKKGGLSGTLKLGNASLPASELRLLRHLFGPSLKTSRQGVHRLNLTQFLEQIPDPEAWIEDLYTTLGRKRQNLMEKKVETELKYQRLLEQLRLAHPGQAAIYDLLSQNPPSRKILDTTGLETLREKWFSLADLVAFLCENRSPVGLSELGARFFNDSKILRTGKLKSELCRWLNVLETGGPGDSMPTEHILDKFGVTDNPTSIKVTLFGNLRYRKQGMWYDWPCELRKNGESVTLSLDNFADLECCEFPGNDTVITCENETPFNTLIREKTPQPIIYTAGFPNTAVRIVLEKLPGYVRVLHWGDSDLAGLRIAGILGRLRTLSLWRCDLPELKRHRKRLRPTTDAEQKAIKDILTECPDHPFAQELRFTAENGWLEQESWQPKT